MCDEIIKNIQRNLSGNSDLDKSYLVSQLDFYKNHEHAPQIIKGISALFWDCLTDDEVDFLDKSHNNNEILKAFDDVIELIEAKDKGSALILLEGFFKNFNDDYSNSSKYQYHSFLNPLEVLIFYNYIGFDSSKLEFYNTEEDKKAIDKKNNTPFLKRNVHSLGNYDHRGFDDPIAYRRQNRKRNRYRGNQININKSINKVSDIIVNKNNGGNKKEDKSNEKSDKENKKELRLIPYSKPLFDLYYIYGSLLAEKSRFDEAEVYLKRALKINPISSKALLELADIYKLRTVTFNRFFLLTMEALKYAYSLKDIAKAYRNIGYYYLEEYNLEVSAVFYNHSLKFENNKNAIKELDYISSRGVDFIIDDEKSLEIIKSKNVQEDVNPFILDSLETLSSYFHSRGFLNQALYFYRIMYELTNDPLVFDMINRLQNKI
ncbi:hypothetical protein [uncultured Methanobrevibacter sp.]|uniref:hypothetical protein n=1 Tax=uncultured Methanobrevibacter sp. TaxID=253161 RepID=UPI00261A4993